MRVLETVGRKTTGTWRAAAGACALLLCAGAGAQQEAFRSYALLPESCKNVSEGIQDCPGPGPFVLRVEDSGARQTAQVLENGKPVARLDASEFGFAGFSSTASASVWAFGEGAKPSGLAVPFIVQTESGRSAAVWVIAKLGAVSCAVGWAKNKPLAQKAAAQAALAPCVKSGRG